MILVFLNEIKTIIFYTIISFVISFFIIFKNFTSIFIFFIFPLIKITGKKLILFHLWELINSMWFLTFLMTVYFLLPINLYFFIYFFNSSWYLIQQYIFKKSIFFIISLFLSFLIFYIILYFFFFKSILIWDFHFFNVYQLFELQFQLNWFLKNQFFFLFSFITFFLILYFFFFQLHLFLSLNILYYKFKIFKKSIFFIISLFLFVMSYDFLFFLILIIFNFLFIEIIFVWVCYKNCNLLKN